MEMLQSELNAILVEHEEWLKDNKKGKRANLQGANLQNANLQYANLRGANLQNADLRDANLQNANLQYANLDYSCFPLWCGGTRFKADDKLVAQFLSHLCSLDVSPEARGQLNKILPFAQTSHRADDCGIL